MRLQIVPYTQECYVSPVAPGQPIKQVGQALPRAVGLPLFKDRLLSQCDLRLLNAATIGTTPAVDFSQMQRLYSHGWMQALG